MGVRPWRNRAVYAEFDHVLRGAQGVPPVRRKQISRWALASDLTA